MKWPVFYILLGLAASVGCVEVQRALRGETAEGRREPDWGPVPINENVDEEDGNQNGDEQLDDSAQDTEDTGTGDEGQDETQEDVGPQPPDETADEPTDETDNQEQPDTEQGPSEPPELADDLEEITSETGLRFIDIEVGTGDQPETGDGIEAHYTGWLEADGTKFDSSLDRGQPITFTLGAGGVIQGWDEGFATMQAGGKRRLIIPPELAYGAGGNSPTIPPDATLIFDVELLNINRQ
jgi:peptidylprolyl isomerase